MLIQEATELVKIFGSIWRRPNKRLYMSIIQLTVASMLVPVEGPEYETIYAFGGLCEIDSIKEIMYLNDICDRLGMDTISAGNLVAFTIEAARQRRIQLKID